MPEPLHRVQSKSPSAPATPSPIALRSPRITRSPAAKWIRRMSPAVFKADLRGFVQDTVRQLKVNAIVNLLYTPRRSREVVPLARPRAFSQQSILRIDELRTELADQALPVPPPDLLYYGTLDRYLLTGQSDALSLRRLMERLGFNLHGLSVLDWGCRDCRVLRHFAPDAQAGNFWGVDQHGASMEWAKTNLSPPFKFVTCSAYPHLPFEDRTFDVLYAMSVLTHVVSLADTWLMELRRVLKPGGYALVTVHDEHTWQFLSQNDEMRNVMNLEKEDIAHAAGGDFVVIDGPDLSSEFVNVFHSEAWIRQQWGQYFEIVSIEPRFMYHQSMVVLRKPA